MNQPANRIIPVVLGAVFLNAIGFGIIMPVLPQLVVRLGHIDVANAATIGGWLGAIYAVGQFFAGPIIGRLGDRYGRRPVLLLAVSAFALDYALMAFAPTLAWLFAGRLVAGVAGSVIAPASAVIADVTPPEKRGARYSMFGAAFGLAFIIGPALGGLVGQYDVRAPFALAAGFALLNALSIAFLLPETLDPANRRAFRLREANVIDAFRPLARAGNATPLLAAWFAFGCAQFVWPSTYSFFCTIRLHWTAGAIGWSLAYVGVFMALVQIALTGRVIARIGERWATIVGLASAITTFVLYAFSSHGWQMYAFFPIGSLAGFVLPSMRALLSRMASADGQGSLQGGVSSLDSLAAIISPFVLTHALAWGVGHDLPGAAFLVAGALTMVALLLIAWTLRSPVVAPAVEHYSGSTPAENPV